MVTEQVILELTARTDIDVESARQDMEDLSGAASDAKESIEAISLGDIQSDDMRDHVRAVREAEQAYADLKTAKEAAAAEAPSARGIEPEGFFTDTEGNRYARGEDGARPVDSDPGGGFFSAQPEPPPRLDPFATGPAMGGGGPLNNDDLVGAVAGAREMLDEMEAAEKVVAQYNSAMEDLALANATILESVLGLDTPIEEFAAKVEEAAQALSVESPDEIDPDVLRGLVSEGIIDVPEAAADMFGGGGDDGRRRGGGAGELVGEMVSGEVVEQIAQRLQRIPLVGQLASQQNVRGAMQGAAGRLSGTAAAATSGGAGAAAAGGGAGAMGFSAGGAAGAGAALASNPVGWAALAAAVAATATGLGVFIADARKTGQRFNELSAAIEASRDTLDAANLDVATTSSVRELAGGTDERLTGEQMQTILQSIGGIGASARTAGAGAGMAGEMSGQALQLARTFGGSNNDAVAATSSAIASGDLSAIAGTTGTSLTENEVQQRIAGDSSLRQTALQDPSVARMQAILDLLSESAEDAAGALSGVASAAGDSGTGSIWRSVFGGTSLEDYDGFAFGLNRLGGGEGAETDTIDPSTGEVGFGFGAGNLPGVRAIDEIFGTGLSRFSIGNAFGSEEELAAAETRAGEAVASGDTSAIAAMMEESRALAGVMGEVLTSTEGLSREEAEARTALINELIEEGTLLRNTNGELVNMDKELVGTVEDLTSLRDVADDVGNTLRRLGQAQENFEQQEAQSDVLFGDTGTMSDQIAGIERQRSFRQQQEAMGGQPFTQTEDMQMDRRIRDIQREMERAQEDLNRSMAQNREARDEGIEDAIDSKNDALEDVADRREDLMERLEELEEDAQENILSGFDPQARTRIGDQANRSAQMLISNAGNQNTLAREQLSGMQELESRGLSSDAMEELGLDEMSPVAVGQIRKLLRASDDELGELSAIFEEKGQIAREALQNPLLAATDDVNDAREDIEDALSDVADAEADILERFADTVQQINERFNEALADMMRGAESADLIAEGSMVEEDDTGQVGGHYDVGPSAGGGVPSAGGGGAGGGASSGTSVSSYNGTPIIARTEDGDTTYEVEGIGFFEDMRAARVEIDRAAGRLTGGSEGGYAALAAGGILTQPTVALMREAGNDEAVIPLDSRGANYMAQVMETLSGGVQHRMSGFGGGGGVDSSTNFNGAMTIVANDPMEMARKLEQRKRLKALTGRGRVTAT